MAVVLAVVTPGDCRGKEERPPEIGFRGAFSLVGKSGLEPLTFTMST
jgi:hypothetical protein